MLARPVTKANTSAVARLATAGLRRHHLLMCSIVLLRRLLLPFKNLRVAQLIDRAFFSVNTARLQANQRVSLDDYKAAVEAGRYRVAFRMLPDVIVALAPQGYAASEEDRLEEMAAFSGQAEWAAILKDIRIHREYRDALVLYICMSVE